jgi:hypothetical protein
LRANRLLVSVRVFNQRSYNHGKEDKKESEEEKVIILHLGAHLALAPIGSVTSSVTLAAEFLSAAFYSDQRAI